MLVMAEYSWFEKFKGSSAQSDRLPGYEEEKEKWLARCLEIFYFHFPKCRGKVELADLSTPLSIERYLATYRGGAVGMDVTPQRFVDPFVRDSLDMASRLPGLYLTGQDSSICGVTLCQLAGVITAFRMTGFFAACKIIASSILLGD